MKVVIDLPNENYQVILTKIMLDSYGCKITEIPKGHGRLIDSDAYRKEMMNSREFNFFKTLDMQPTIIEADKEASDGIS